MSLLGLVILLVIAAVAGSIGQAISGYSIGGCIVSIILGFVGAYVGLWLAQQLNLPTFIVVNVGGDNFPLVWAIVGSALLSLALGLVFRSRRPLL